MAARCNILWSHELRGVERMRFALKAPHGRLHTERRRQAVRFSTHDLLRARQVPDADTRWWAPIYVGFGGLNADQRQPALVGVVTACVTAVKGVSSPTGTSPPAPGSVGGRAGVPDRIGFSMAVRPSGPQQQHVKKA